MKRVFVLAAILAVIALALILTEAFLYRPIPGVSFSGEITDPAELGESAIFLD